MSDATIYDFEGIFEPPIASLYAVGGLTAWTSRGEVTIDEVTKKVKIIDGDPMQKDRPRVEVIFTRGAGRMQWHPGDNTAPYGSDVESAWRGNVSITLVTDPRGSVHFGLLPTVRRITAGIPAALNEVQITTHKIQWPLIETGETHRYDRSQGGYFATTITLTFDFSVQKNAWPLLQQP
jgi:hypothetical protein